MSIEESAPSPAGTRHDGTSGDAPKAPDDPQALREEIERTREQLGATVEALAAKADVKAQAQQKLSQLTGRLKTAATQAKRQGVTRAGQVQRQLADKTAGPRQKAGSISGTAAGQVKTATGQFKQGAATAAASISKVTPEPVQRAAGNAAKTARKHRGPLAAAAGAIGAAVLAFLLILRRRRS